MGRVNEIKNRILSMSHGINEADSETLDNMDMELDVLEKELRTLTKKTNKEPITVKRLDVQPTNGSIDYITSDGKKVTAAPFIAKFENVDDIVRQLNNI